MTNSISKAARPIWFCCFFFCAFFGFSQEYDYQMTGYLVNFSGKPLANLSIMVNDDPILITTTDSIGRFVVQSPKVINFMTISEGIYAQKILVNVPEDRQKSTSWAAETTWRIAPRTKTLGVAVVNGFGKEELLYKKPGSSVFLDKRALVVGQEASLQNALQTKAGIRLDSRGYGGSQRISIRGSFLRAPFAVRNIKLYLDGVPLTSTDGQSSLELIDGGTISGIEVLKGPSGTVYGAGNGGVILASSRHAKEGSTPYVSAAVTAGDFGFVRQELSYKLSDESWSISGFKIAQATDGYRNQESNGKNQSNFDFTYRGLEKIILSAKYIRYTGEWDLPGSLTPAQVDEDPTQAVAYSENIGARVERDRDLLSAQGRFFITEDWKLTTTLFSHFTKKINPFGTTPFFNGLKVERGRNFGARVENTNDFDFGEMQLSLVSGGEWQSGNDDLNSYEIGRQRTPDFANYLTKIASVRYTAFTMAHLSCGNLRVGLGAGMNGAAYANEDFFDPEVLPTNLADIKYAPKFLPRAYLGYSFKDAITAFVEYGTGQSLPGFLEVVDADEGVINANLAPELGQNIEVGIKGLLWKNKIHFNANVFQFTLDNTIVPAQEASGLLTYENKGRTNQNGVELELTEVWVDQDKGFLQLMQTAQAYSANDFTFGNDYKSDTDLNGNDLTGVPLNTFSQQVEFEFAKGFNLAAYHFWTDRTPLNDRNSVWGPAYHVVNAQIGWANQFGNMQLSLAAGANNLTDTKYTSFYQLNGFRGKFFNPAPSLNFWGKVKVRVLF